MKKYNIDSYIEKNRQLYGKKCKVMLDTMEEVFENREQIEISKYYERQPKPSLVAIEEFKDGEVHYRMAKQDEE